MMLFGDFGKVSKDGHRMESMPVKVNFVLISAPVDQIIIDKTKVTPKQRSTFGNLPANSTGV
jgi:hypothetical protein